MPYSQEDVERFVEEIGGIERAMDFLCGKLGLPESEQLHWEKAKKALSAGTAFGVTGSCYCH